MIWVIGLLCCAVGLLEGWWHLTPLPRYAHAARHRRAIDQTLGTAAYIVAYALSIARLPLALLPYLTKLLCHFVIPLGYKTRRSGEWLEGVGMVGDLLNLGITAAAVCAAFGPPQAGSTSSVAYLPLLAEALRLCCEKGRMCASAAWQLLPHRRIAACLGGARVPHQFAPLFADYRRYYQLADRERLALLLGTLKERTAADPALASPLSYVHLLRIVPDEQSLRAGAVRDVAAGAVFVHRRWTNDPDLLIGQALRRGPWLFDPRHLRRPFRYRSEANRRATLLVLRNARLCPGYAIYQFGHEIKVARYDLFFRLLRIVGRDLEEPVRADGTHRFDWLIARLERRWATPCQEPTTPALWSPEAALADLRRRRAIGDCPTAPEIARDYLFPREYVDEVLLATLNSGMAKVASPETIQQSTLTKLATAVSAVGD